MAKQSPAESTWSPDAWADGTPIVGDMRRFLDSVPRTFPALKDGWEATIPDGSGWVVKVPPIVPRQKYAPVKVIDPATRRTVHYGCERPSDGWTGKPTIFVQGEGYGDYLGWEEAIPAIVRSICGNLPKLREDFAKELSQ